MKLGFTGLVLLVVPMAVINTVVASPLNGEILEYGYYLPLKKMERIRNYSTPTGYARQGNQVTLVKQSARIPAIIGQLFGFRFRISGFDPSINETWLRLVVKHPLMIRPNGSRTEGYSQTLSLPVKNGVLENKSGYKLDQEFEMVTGQWRFEYWRKDELILEQVFEVQPATDDDYKYIATAREQVVNEGITKQGVAKEDGIKPKNTPISDVQLSEGSTNTAPLSPAQPQTMTEKQAAKE